MAGNTVTRRLSREQYERYQPWFDNHRRLRELTAKLEQLSLRTAEAAEGLVATQDLTVPHRITAPRPALKRFCDSLLSSGNTHFPEASR